MLDFNNDAQMLDSEKAAASLLEHGYGIKTKIVSGKYLKYDLIVDEGNQFLPKGTTIDVKANLNTKYNNIFLEVVNIGWNGNLAENDFNVESIIDTKCIVKSWGWSFSYNMSNTDYILFLDKEWNNKAKKGNRIAYLIPRTDILENNYETEIKNKTKKVKWNKISYSGNNQWRSAYIISSLNDFKNKIKINF